MLIRVVNEVGHVLLQSADRLYTLFEREHELSEAVIFVQSEIELKEALLLLAELELKGHGAINGSNAEIRKLQTITFLAEARKTTPSYLSLCEDAEEVRTKLAQVRMQIKQELYYFDAHKHQARMVAALKED